MLIFDHIIGIRVELVCRGPEDRSPDMKLKFLHSTDISFKVVVKNFEQDILNSFEIMSFVGEPGFWQFFHTFSRIA